MKKEVYGIVQNVVENGKHGAYVVATCEGLSGSVTFSLDQSCWSETTFPQEGDVVVLSGLRRKRAGWRATRARLLCPNDPYPAKERR